MPRETMRGPWGRQGKPWGPQVPDTPKTLVFLRLYKVLAPVKGSMGGSAGTMKIPWGGHWGPRGAHVGPWGIHGGLMGDHVGSHAGAWIYSEPSGRRGVHLFIYLIPGRLRPKQSFIDFSQPHTPTGRSLK